MIYFYLLNEYSRVGWWPLWVLLSLFFPSALIIFSKIFSKKVGISARKKILENF